jgi:hypothetical protein
MKALSPSIVLRGGMRICSLLKISSTIWVKLLFLPFFPRFKYSEPLSVFAFGNMFNSDSFE